MLLCSLILVSCSISHADENGWLKVHDLLDNFQNLTDCDGCNCPGCKGFAFTAGNASGRQFAFEKETKLDDVLVMASASKFPAAIAISGAVAAGHLHFETFAHEVFPWWSANASDPRSSVTLRQLLSFTSGFYWPDASSGNVSCMAGVAGAVRFTPEECAQQIYENAPFPFRPGTTWAYNSFHLQVAAAMAAKAARITVKQLLYKFLIGKLGLQSTGWLVGQNPLLAAGMFTTANDYDIILRSFLNYELLPEPVASQLEIDYLSPGSPGMQPSGAVVDVNTWCVDLVSYFGHYSMCNWFECIACDDPDYCARNDSAIDIHNQSSWLTPACRAAQVHSDLGLFGFYPLIDRKKGMYMQIGQAVIVGLNDTNFACAQATLLRLIIKPAVDAALGLEPRSVSPADRTQPQVSAVPVQAYSDTSPAFYGELGAALEGYLEGKGQSKGMVECAAVAEA